MQIIYIHGLDSSSNSIKGNLLKSYAHLHYPFIQVIQPDLNHSPDKVVAQLSALIDDNTVLVGSSLGGYFATLMGHLMDCHMVLLNPSIRPDKSLSRFFTDIQPNDLNNIGYQTQGGWQITRQDLHWFSQHLLTSLDFKKNDSFQKILPIIQKGDELLDYRLATDFYEKQGVQVILQEGGNHRMSNFDEQLPMIFQWILNTVDNKYCKS